MNNFEFGRPVSICGEVYYLQSDMERTSKILSQQAKAVRKPGASEAEIKMGCKIALDTLLGKGAFEKIFQGRKFLVSDATSLLIFLTKEIKAWREEMAAEMNSIEEDDPDTTEE